MCEIKERRKEEGRKTKDLKIQIFLEKKIDYPKYSLRF